MIQRLAMALAQVKAGNKSDKLLNEKIYILCMELKTIILKKTYNNITNSVKL